MISSIHSRWSIEKMRQSTYCLFAENSGPWPSFSQKDTMAFLYEEDNVWLFKWLESEDSLSLASQGDTSDVFKMLEDQGWTILANSCSVPSKPCQECSESFLYPSGDYLCPRCREAIYAQPPV